ncbi:MAG: TonB-dependent receptor [Gemmatimonadaceae bacterium]
MALTAYSGLDVLDEGGSATGDSSSLGTMRNVGFDWGNRVGGITWVQPVTPTTTFMQRASFSTFHTQFEIPAESLSIVQRMGDARLSGRLTHETARHTLTAGYELSNLRSAYRERLAPSTDSPFPDALASDGDTTIAQRGDVSVLHVDDVWRVSQRFIVRPGLRAERMGGAGWQQLSPRLMARYFVSPDFAVSATAGRFSQWTHAVRNEDLPLRLFDLWMISGPGVPVSTSSHVILGAERWLASSRFIRLEAYGKRYSTLTEPASTIDPRVRPSLLRTFDGASYGIDAMIRQLEHGPISGWITYGYSLSSRERDGVRYFAAHDRRHNANVVMRYAPSQHWTLGMHAALATGTPYTGWAGRMSRWHYDPLVHRWTAVPGTNDVDIVHGTRNGERLPVCIRDSTSAQSVVSRQRGGHSPRPRASSISWIGETSCCTPSISRGANSASYDIHSSLSCRR